MLRLFLTIWISLLLISFGLGSFVWYITIIWSLLFISSSVAVLSYLSEICPERPAGVTNFIWMGSWQVYCNQCFVFCALHNHLQTQLHLGSWEETPIVRTYTYTFWTLDRFVLVCYSNHQSSWKIQDLLLMFMSVKKSTKNLITGSPLWYVTLTEAFDLYLHDFIVYCHVIGWLDNRINKQVHRCT